MNNYIRTIYSESERPKTDYPQYLVKYLFDRFHLKKGQKFLEPGCGRGDFLIEFKKLGLEVFGIDISEESKEIIKDCNIKIADIEKDGIPFSDNYFYVIYSKSFIEHLYHPEKFRQLPVVWKHKWINIFCSIISPFIPVRTKNKFLRWSRELMIAGVGYKE